LILTKIVKSHDRWVIENHPVFAIEQKRDRNILVLRTPGYKYRSQVFMPQSYEPASFRVYKILTSAGNGDILSCELLVEFPLRSES
jgi:hypothetical protein